MSRDNASYRGPLANVNIGHGSNPLVNKGKRRNISELFFRVVVEQHPTGPSFDGLATRSVDDLVGAGCFVILALHLFVL